MMKVVMKMSNKEKIASKTVSNFLDILFTENATSCTKEKKEVFYYSMPLENTDLMSEMELGNKIDNLSILLSTLPLNDLQFFSYEKPTDLSQNIIHKRELLDEKFVNEGQYRLLTGIHQDYENMEKSVLHADKNILIAFSFNEEDKAVKLELVDDMLLRFNAKRLKNKDLLIVFNTYLLKNMQSIENITEFIDNKKYLPKSIEFLSRHFKVDGKFRKIWAIKNYPSDTEYASFAPLIQLPNVHVSMHLKKNNDDIKKMVNKLGKYNSQKFTSSNATDKFEASNDNSKLKVLFDELANEKSALFNTTILIEMVANTKEELLKLEKKVEANLVFLKMGTDKLMMRQKEGFLSCLPLNNNKIINRSHPFTSKSFASLYPFSYISKNDIMGILLGKIAKGNSLIADFFARNSNQLNGNTFISAQPGAGKTVQLMNILFQYVAFGVRTFSLDPEGEIGIKTAELGGLNVNVASGKFRINIFEIREFGTDEGEDEITNFEVILSNHISWMINFFKAYRNDFTGALAETVNYFLYSFYHEEEIFNNAKVGIYPIASEFYEYIEKNEYIKNSDIISPEQRKLALLYLHPLCKGVDSILFNGQTNVSEDNNINFNLQSLLIGSEERMQASIYNIITYIFSIAVKNRNDAISAGLNTEYIEKIVLAIDELYLLLNKRAPALAIELRNLMKRARKYNVIVLLSTQNLIDVLQQGLIEYTMPLLSTSNKKILLNPGMKEAELVKGNFMLSDKEMGKLVNAARGEFLFIDGTEKYFVAGDGHLLPAVSEVIV
jgi:Type IV secretory pathway, VirB4 components